MGLRARIKERLGGLLGSSAAAAPASAPLTPQVRSSAPEGPGSPPPMRVAPAAPSAPPPKALSPEEQAKQDKIAAHFEKARRGVMRNLVEVGGKAAMADMHDHSERRYFIAHQAFSRMMEGFVAEGLIDYDTRLGEATVTEKGRAFASEGAPPQA